MTNYIVFWQSRSSGVIRYLSAWESFDEWTKFRSKAWLVPHDRINEIVNTLLADEDGLNLTVEPV